MAGYVLGTYAGLLTAFLLELVHANIDRYLRSNFYGTAQTREVSINEHEMIIQTCREGDFESASKLLRDHILKEGPVTASTAKTVLGSSRKYIIPLLEHFDEAGVTVREGNVRRLAT